jgi:hypothetical protein
VKDVRERLRDCVPSYLLDDDSDIEDDGTLQFLLLVFDVLAASWLIVKPVDGVVYLPLSLD